MRDACFTLALLTWCASGELSQSSELFLVQPGENVTLPCSEPLNYKIVWFRLLSDEMIALTTTVKENIGDGIVTEHHSSDTGLFTTQEDNHTKSISLTITRVTESEQGLYYCIGWERGEIRFGKGIRLIFPDTEKRSPSCWTLLAFVAPAVAVVTTLCFCALCHRRVCSPAVGRHTVRNNNNMKEADLHYASLQLPNKTQPSHQRETPPLSGDIIYA